MTKLTFSLEQIRAMARPAGYEAELAACAVARTETEMTFDADSLCYRALVAKYGSAEAAAGARREAVAPRRGCNCGGRPVEGV